MKLPLIFNIQKFSTHDGPGVRTTVFFKGCPIRCQWCHNPESQSFQAEEMLDKDGKPQLMGQTYEVKDLLKILEKDQLFYEESGGGVTFSGGEVLAQSTEYLVAMGKGLQQKGISLAIDTCGVIPERKIEAILPYTDLFLYDLKFINSQLHEKYTGTPNHLVLENLKFINRHGGNIDLRLIIIKGLNDDALSIQKILDFLQAEKIRLTQVSLLPYHDFGRDKYNKLQRECTQNFEKPTDERVNEIKEAFEKAGYHVQIGG